MLSKLLRNTLYWKCLVTDSGHRCSFLLNPIVVVMALLAVILTFIMINAYLNKSNKIDDKKEEIPNSLQHSDDYPVELQFVQRESWGAAQPLKQHIENILPLRRVIFIHTVSSSCNSYRSCVESVRNIQELHMDDDHKWGDIGYNFVLGGDGYIYVGVGWDNVGVHTVGFNNGSLGVAFIGDFRTDELNEKMTLSAIRLLKLGVERKKLSEDYQLFGHCQILSGFPVSPGKNIMKVIKYWDHWNDTNIDNCK